MNWISAHLLSWTLFSPLLGLILLFLVSEVKLQRIVTLIWSLVPFVLSLALYQNFQGTGEFEFQETVPWFQSVFYRVGIDGFSLPMVLLITFLVPLVVLSTWSSVEKNVRSFLVLLLILETGMLGVFVSLDVLLFYIFWEVQIIPMYFLIGAWGGTRRIYAAIKFFLYTMAGSLVMLAAILYLYFAGGRSFNISELYLATIPQHAQWWLFLAFALAFAIKVPLFPFHTWLPDAHVEAPTAGSVLLAGVLLKMGTYGFIRFAIPLFPEAARFFSPLLSVLAVIGIIYGSLVAMVQPDLKKLVAYTSVAHLGFVVLGISSGTAQGLAGATLQMVNHGLSTGALFFLVGVIYERRHTRLIADFGGLAKVMPLYTLCFLIVTLSSIGLPGTNGFVGEFLILLGSFKTNPWLSSVAVLGVVLGAVAMLWMFQRIFWGPVTEEKNQKLLDLSLREGMVLLPILIMIFVIGIAPGFLLRKMDRSVFKFVDRVDFHGKIITN